MSNAMLAFWFMVFMAWCAIAAYSLVVVFIGWRFRQ
jgi:hypothetical protein